MDRIRNLRALTSRNGILGPGWQQPHMVSSLLHTAWGSPRTPCASWPGKWALFLAVMGFIGCALMVLAAFLFGLSFNLVGQLLRTRSRHRASASLPPRSIMLAVVYSSRRSFCSAFCADQAGVVRPLSTHHRRLPTPEVVSPMSASW